MYDYEEYYEDDYGYDEDVINESALDMAMDMSERYDIAIEDAYDFACDALEGSLKDPHKRELREFGRREIAVGANNDSCTHMRNKANADSAWARAKHTEDVRRNQRLDARGLKHINSLGPIAGSLYGKRELERRNASVRRRYDKMAADQDRREALIAARHDSRAKTYNDARNEMYRSGDRIHRVNNAKQSGDYGTLYFDD